VKDLTRGNVYRRATLISLLLVLSFTNINLAEASSKSSFKYTPQIIQNLFMKVDVASGKVAQISKEVASNDSASKAQAEKDLVLAKRNLASVSKAARIAILSALKAHPASIKLLKTYAIAFNDVVTSHLSEQEAITSLKAARADLVTAQDAFSALGAGGLIPAGPEADSAQAKIDFANEIIVTIQQKYTEANQRTVLAELELGTSSLAVKEDQLASLALRIAKGGILKGAKNKINPNPLSWF
jgi:hypothetical protein